MDVRKYRFTTNSYNAPVLQFCSLTKVILKAPPLILKLLEYCSIAVFKGGSRQLKDFGAVVLLVDVSPAVAHVGSRSLVGENFGLKWNCGSDEMKMLS